ncbi:MAG TPA: rhomboid family intramembrane serine protease [Tepiditoga sp.]|nr:rhomboid family intramembrane serine protease [Tepiditoga sp.]
MEKYGLKKSVTNYIILINAFIFALMFIFGGFGAFSNGLNLIKFGAQYGGMGNSQWFRMITSMFVHGGFWHILLNMYALYYFGNLTENVYGKYKYLSVYLLSGFAGNLLTALVTSGMSISVGASGAIFGLIGLLFGSGFRSDTPHMMKRFTGTALLPVIIINIIFGFTMSGINNMAHIGGLIAGFTFGWLTPVTYTSTSWKIWKILYYISIAIIAVSFVLLVIFDIYLFG